MADLRPRISVNPEVGSAQNAYQDAFRGFIDSLDKPFDRVDKYVSDMEKKKLAKEERDEEQRRWDIVNTRAEADAKRKEDTYTREVAEKTATNEALKAVLDPTGFKTGKMNSEQAAIQSSLNALNPEDRLLAEKQLEAYKPEQSSAQWLSTALGNANADQSKIMSTRKSAYDFAASQPGTSEYEARVAADRAEKEWALNAQMRKQMQMENYKEAKERKALEGLLGALKTGTTTTNEVRTGNEDYINAVDKTNKALDTKAEAYAEKFSDLLTNSKELQARNAKIDGLNELIESTKAKASLFGDTNSPEVARIEKLKKDEELARDNFIAYLDKGAKELTGTQNVDLYKREKLPEYSEVVTKETKPVGKEEWTNTAIANAGPNITSTVLTNILNRAETLYPKADPKELIKAREKDMTASDYKTLIQSSTGQPAKSTTVEALKQEYEATLKKKEPKDTYGVGPLSQSLMLAIGLSAADIKDIAEKADTKKIKDVDLVKIIKEQDEATWTDSGTATNLKTILDNLDTIK